jgi:hypothetical protein
MRMEESDLKNVLITQQMANGFTLKQALDNLSKGKYAGLFQEVVKTEKKLKHGNKITKVDGITFRSRKEADYYCVLKIRFMAGEIIGLVLQPKFVLQEGTDTEQAITYSADFLIINPDYTCEVVDTKGFESEQWERTYKMFKIKYPKINLKVVK